MFTRIAGRLVGLLFLGACCFLAWVPRGQGQDNQLIPESFREDFDKTYGERQKLIAGQRPPGKEDEKLMDITARWYVHRVTFNKNKTQPEEMAKYYESLEKELIAPLRSANNKGNNKVFVVKLGKHLAERLREVLTRDLADPDNRAPVLNAAAMLPLVAKLQQEEIGDLLVDLLKDKKRHDAVKLYAAKAMGEFFPAKMVTDLDDPKDAKTNLQFKRDKERLEALVSFIHPERPAPTDEGERDAIRFMRREAVASLAQIGVPAVKALKKKGELVGPAAYELMRVLVKGKGAFDPPPSLPERVEAALGLCQLQDPGREADYDPSLAVYAVGLCFHDYATAYAKDYVNISGRKDPKNIDKNSKIPTMYWRIESERFKLAMKDMVSNTKGTPALASARKLDERISRIADSMKAYNAVDSQDLLDFGKLVNAVAPKTGKLYKKGPEIDVGSLQGGAPVDAD